MKKAYVFLTAGFEEIEAVSVIDILRRGGVDLKICSLTGEMMVKSARKLMITCDMLIEDSLMQDNDITAADALILPGGQILDGYSSCSRLSEIIRNHAAEGKLVAAICAAPVYLGRLGMLEGKTAVCYLGMEAELTGALAAADNIVYDAPFLTAKGPGFSIPFALNVLELLCGADIAKKVAEGMLL